MSFDQVNCEKSKLKIIKSGLRSSIGNAAKFEAFLHICSRTFITRGKFNIKRSNRLKY